MISLICCFDEEINGGVEPGVVAESDVWSEHDLADKNTAWKLR